MKSVLDASLFDTRTRFRIQVKHAVAIGPGKADILQGVADTGSLAETGRRLGMSYQRVWSLVDAMNHDFLEPLVLKQRGGTTGGGARLTETGARVLALFRAIEHDAQHAVARRLPDLLAMIRPDVPGPATEIARAVKPPSRDAAAPGSRQRAKTVTRPSRQPRG